MTVHDLIPMVFDDGHSPDFVRRFAALVRKLWNPRAFKAQVSPHEFIQEVNTVSKGRFRLMEQGDPVDFLSWLLNQIHLDLNAGHRKRPSIVSTCFQGEVRIESQKVYVRTGLEQDDEKPQADVDKLDSDGRKEGGQEDEHGNAKFNLSRDVEVARSPFFLLAIDLPPPPVFQDAVEKNIIPQVSIASVLAKYESAHDLTILDPAEANGLRELCAMHSEMELGPDEMFQLLK